MGWYSEAELSWGFCIPKDRLARLFRCLRKHYRVKAKPKSKTEQEEQPKPAKRPRVEGAEDKDEEEKEDKSEEEDKEDDDDEDEDDYEDDYVNEKELDEYLSRVLDDEKYNRAFRFRCMSDVIEGYGVFGGSGRYAEGGGVEEVVIAHTESSYSAERYGGLFGSSVAGIGTELYSPGQNQDLLRQLEIDLHLAEIGMDLPVKEQWLLGVNIVG
ncbi:hypothetical protein BOTBODRAFT_43100 [Botryobasidium botryosum FD-172 SS1]|uniref:Uncharacterized protein n=1 Tax=Botryobasidium botryosum (strain FD-172 SS1) TaxID=930990 RepID=A0A067MZJ1_BOTB1|nr:hypothetical protein BOTBODRAFT_43100 [Botryobasidium botryosum FD-172 SS1]